MNYSTNQNKMEPLYRNPDKLITLGLERFDMDSSDVRTVLYRKYLFTIAGLNSYLEIDFTLVIDDDPHISYLESSEYTFEGSYVRTTEHNLEEDNFTYPIMDVRTKVNIDTTKKIRDLIKAADKLCSIF